jgi:hypothetical protein
MKGGVVPFKTASLSRKICALKESLLLFLWGMENRNNPYSSKLFPILSFNRDKPVDGYSGYFIKGISHIG